MSTVHKNSKSVKKRSTKTTAAEDSKPKRTAVDAREQLANEGEIGSIEQVSLPLAMITSLRGIPLDIDPLRFWKAVGPPKIRSNPAKFHDHVLRPMLARHPVLAKAEVRVSGRGLHVIIWFVQPVEFSTDADRQRWAAIVRVIQRLLPTDPDCPGITAMTRPVGSINGRNGAKVRRLHKGEPVSAEDVLALYTLARTSPFKTIANLLLGNDHVKPCPVCNVTGTGLDALDHVGRCYGSCGKVHIGQLFDVFLRPRPTKAKE